MVYIEHGRLAELSCRSNNAKLLQNALGIHRSPALYYLALSNQCCSNHLLIHWDTGLVCQPQHVVIIQGSVWHTSTLSFLLFVELEVEHSLLFAQNTLSSQHYTASI